MRTLKSLTIRVDSEEPSVILAKFFTDGEEEVEGSMKPEVVEVAESTPLPEVVLRTFKLA